MEILGVRSYSSRQEIMFPPLTLSHKYPPPRNRNGNYTETYVYDRLLINSFGQTRPSQPLVLNESHLPQEGLRLEFMTHLTTLISSVDYGV